MVECVHEAYGRHKVAIHTIIFPITVSQLCLANKNEADIIPQTAHYQNARAQVYITRTKSGNNQHCTIG